MIWSQCVINMLFGVHTIHNVFLCYMRNKKYNSKSSHGVLLCINSFRNFYNTFLRYIQIEFYITGILKTGQISTNNNIRLYWLNLICIKIFWLLSQGVYSCNKWHDKITNSSKWNMLHEANWAYYFSFNKPFKHM